MKLRELLTENVIKRAKKKFGVTNSYLKAGYILPNGEMLDFSGRHLTKDPEAIKYMTRREVDHADVKSILDIPVKNAGKAVSNFIDKGPIRFHFDPTGSVLITLSKKPTEAQLRRIQKLLPRIKYIAIDIWDEWAKVIDKFTQDVPRTMTNIRKFLRKHFKG